MRNLDPRANKLLTMYKVTHLRGNINGLYVKKRDVLSLLSRNFRMTQSQWEPKVSRTKSRANRGSDGAKTRNKKRNEKQGYRHHKRNCKWDNISREKINVFLIKSQNNSSWTNSIKAKIRCNNIVNVNYVKMKSVSYKMTKENNKTKVCLGMICQLLGTVQMTNLTRQINGILINQNLSEIIKNIKCYGILK